MDDSTGFVTGSRAFGTHSPDSDWDFAIPIYHLDTVLKEIKDSGRIITEEKSHYFNGIKFYMQDNLGKFSMLNLIPIHPHEYKAWGLTTISLKDSMYLSDISHRIQKHAVFMTMVSSFKGCLEEKKEMEAYIKMNTEFTKNINFSLLNHAFHPFKNKFKFLFGDSSEISFSSKVVF